MMENMIFICACVLSAIYGLCVGSFLNVVIYRFPIGLSLAKPTSHCPQCKKPISWYDNIPVLSYLFLGGKCRNCKAHISFRYTIVEIINAVLWWASVFLFWQQSIVFAVCCAIACSILLAIFFIDLENMVIPDILNLLLGVTGVVAIFSGDGIKWHERLIGAAVGLLFFGAMKFGSKLLLGRDGIGGGDVLLMGAAGLLLGWKSLLLSMLVSSVVGSVILVVLSVKNKDKNKEYPFAPFLCGGIIIALLFGSKIISWYIGMLLDF